MLDWSKYWWFHNCAKHWSQSHQRCLCSRRMWKQTWKFFSRSISLFFCQPSNSLFAIQKQDKFTSKGCSYEKLVFPILVSLKLWNLVKNLPRYGLADMKKNRTSCPGSWQFERSHQLRKRYDDNIKLVCWNLSVEPVSTECEIVSRSVIIFK